MKKRGFPSQPSARSRFLSQSAYPKPQPARCSHRGSAAYLCLAVSALPGIACARSDAPTFPRPSRGECTHTHRNLHHPNIVSLREIVVSKTSGVSKPVVVRVIAWSHSPDRILQMVAWKVQRCACTRNGRARLARAEFTDKKDALQDRVRFWSC